MQSPNSIKPSDRAAWVIKDVQSLPQLENRLAVLLTKSSGAKKWGLPLTLDQYLWMDRDRQSGKYTLLLDRNKLSGLLQEFRSTWRDEWLAKSSTRQSADLLLWPISLSTQPLASYLQHSSSPTEIIHVTSTEVEAKEKKTQEDEKGVESVILEHLFKHKFESSASAEDSWSEMQKRLKQATELAHQMSQDTYFRGTNLSHGQKKKSLPLPSLLPPTLLPPFLPMLVAMG